MTKTATMTADYWGAMCEQLGKWLDGQRPITEANIGEIRRAAFLPFACEWNAIVRAETAAREVRTAETLREGAAKMRADYFLKDATKYHQRFVHLWNAVQKIRGLLAPRPGNGMPLWQWSKENDELISQAHEIAFEIIRSIQEEDRPEKIDQSHKPIGPMFAVTRHRLQDDVVVEPQPQRVFPVRETRLPGDRPNPRQG